MKVSEFLREYQLTGKVPETPDDPLIAFYGGWMMGRSTVQRQTTGPDLESAIKAAEFIEDHARQG